MGRAPCCDKANVKRGPWSPEEDATLKNYLHKHGTGGNWISLPQRAGLKRCGKSCRLRWLNYLRPDIKHGAFTEEEDNIIISLFYKMGSRWSVIAANLPGRTDNDVKNHWNTKLKKKLFGTSSGNINLNTCPKIDVPFNYYNNNDNNNTNNNNIIFNQSNVFKGSTSSSTPTPSPSPSPTTTTYINNSNNNNYYFNQHDLHQINHHHHQLYVPIPSFSTLLAQCSSTTSPMSLLPNFSTVSNLDHPLFNNTHDPIPSPSSSRYPVHQPSSTATVPENVAGAQEEGSSVSGSSSAVYGSSSMEDDPFLAELGFGLMQEVMMNPTCSYGDQEDIKPQGLGQSVAN